MFATRFKTYMVIVLLITNVCGDFPMCVGHGDGCSATDQKFQAIKNSVIDLHHWMRTCVQAGDDCYFEDVVGANIALISYHEKPSCTGALLKKSIFGIDKWLILSAAHCFYGRGGTSFKQIGQMTVEFGYTLPTTAGFSGGEACFIRDVRICNEYIWEHALDSTYDYAIAELDCFPEMQEKMRVNKVEGLEIAPVDPGPQVDSFVRYGFGATRSLRFFQQSSWWNKPGPDAYIPPKFITHATTIIKRIASIWPHIQKYGLIAFDANNGLAIKGDSGGPILKEDKIIAVAASVLHPTDPPKNKINPDGTNLIWQTYIGVAVTITPTIARAVHEMANGQNGVSSNFISCSESAVGDKDECWGECLYFDEKKPKCPSSGIFAKLRSNQWKRNDDPFLRYRPCKTMFNRGKPQRQMLCSKKVPVAAAHVGYANYHKNKKTRSHRKAYSRLVRTYYN